MYSEDSNNDYDPYSSPEMNIRKRSHALAFAALVFGIFSLLGGLVFYVSIPCGALAILFALLSRGNTRLNGSQKASIALGAAGIISSTLITLFMFYSVWTNPSLRAQVAYLFDRYAEELGLDYRFDDIFGEGAGIGGSQQKENEEAPYYNSDEFWDDLFSGKDSGNSRNGSSGNSSGDDSSGDGSYSVPGDSYGDFFYGYPNGSDDDLRDFWYNFPYGSDPSPDSDPSPSGGDFI